MAYSQAELLVTKSQLDQVIRERDWALAQVAELQVQLTAASSSVSRSKDEATQALVSTQVTLARREAELRALGERYSRLENDADDARSAAATLRGSSAALQREIDDLASEVSG